MAAFAFGAKAAVKVSLDVTGQVLVCEGAKVTNIKVDHDERKQLSLSFDFAPTGNGPATIMVAGLKMQNWILHEGPLQLGKYTFEEFAKGVKIDEPVAARLAKIPKRSNSPKACISFCTSP